MLHIAMTKSDFGNSDSDHVAKFSFTGDHHQLICPKPRRLGPATVPELLKPTGCTKHSQSNSFDGRIPFSSMIDAKALDGRWCYSGSPPDRSDNPLSRDVHFIHQMELLSPFTRRELSNKFGFASAPQV